VDKLALGALICPPPVRGKEHWAVWIGERREERGRRYTS